ncbi:MAG: substrate-binding domain-containing protein [Vagococcus sp.]
MRGLAKPWQGNVLIVILLIMLGVLFGHYIKKEPKTHPVQLSVIIRNSGTDYGQSALKQGIDQATNDFDVEVSTIFIEDTISSDDQLTLIQKEVKNGAEGLVIEPKKGEKLEAYLNMIGKDIPIVLVNSRVGEQDQAPVVQSNQRSMGKALGKYVKNRHTDKEKTVGIIIHEQSFEEEISQYEGLVEELQSDQIQVETLYINDLKNDKDSGKWLENGQIGSVIGMRMSDVIKLSELKKQNMAFSQINVYGFGKTNSIILDLEMNRVQGVVVSNQYAVGYLSIQNMIKGTMKQDNVAIHYSVITGDTLFNKENEQLLFPFIQ